jgi:hypothetical protein
MIKTRAAITGLLLSLSLSFASAQADICPDIVKKALASVQQSCGQLGRNQVCYGSNRIEATFDSPTEITFNQPSDRAPLDVTRSLRTFALDEKLGLWGVALMNVQADLPNALPGQGVKFILYGDVQITNKGAAQPTADCPAVLKSAYKMRGGPGQNSNIVTMLENGKQLQAKARNADGSWIYTGDGWVDSGNVTLSCNAMTDLKEYDPNSSAVYGPMQAFTVTTGIGQPKCQQAQSSLVVQSPKGFRVTLNANGLDVNVGSTVAFTANPKAKMKIRTLQGEAVTNFKGKVQVIPAGFESNADLGGDDELTVTNDPDRAELAPEDDLSPLEAIVNDTGDEVEDIPAEPTYTSIQAYCADPNNADVCSDPAFTADDTSSEEPPDVNGESPATAEGSAAGSEGPTVEEPSGATSVDEQPADSAAPTDSSDASGGDSSNSGSDTGSGDGSGG